MATSRSITFRYALRSLRRNVRRTILSAVGLGVGCAIGLISLSWVRGEGEMMIRAASEGGAGHLRVVPAAWVEDRERDLRLADGDGTLSRVRAQGGVSVAAPRVRTQGLLAMGTRVSSVEIVGVDPRAEPGAYRFVRNITEGRYLKADDEGAVVIGRALAEQLDSRAGDELVVTIVDSTGELRSALWTIVGIAASGSREIDLTICQATLADVGALTGISGVGEVTVVLEDHRTIEEFRGTLASGLGPGDTVIAWYDVMPELQAGREIDEVWTYIVTLIIFLLVVLGVTSAQLTGVLQRRRELAVLAALGMRGGQLVRVMMGETFALGLIGFVIALAIAVPVAYYLGTVGVDLRDLMGDEEGFAMSGVLLDPIFYADFGFWLVPYALVLSLSPALVAAIYPTLYALRNDPADAMRVAL